MSGTAAWIWVGSGAAAAAAGLVLALWALFWDRARGRKRCPKCWYDMAGVPNAAERGSWVCPECSRTVHDEAGLLRTRRRWDVALAGVMVLMGGLFTAHYPRYRHEGWVGWVPTSLLVFAAPMGGLEWERENAPGWAVFSPPEGTPACFLIRRAYREGLYTWQSRVAHRRAIDAHPSQASKFVIVPRAWPSDTPLHVRFNGGYTLFRSGREDRYCVYARLKDSGDPWVVSRTDGFVVNDADFQPVSTRPLEHGAVVLEIRLKDEGGEVWRGEVVYSVTVGGPIGEFVSPFIDPGATKTLLLTKPRVERFDGRWYFVMNDPMDVGGLQCSLAVRVEVLRREELVGVARMSFPNMFAFLGFSYMHSPIKVSPIAWAIPAPTDFETDTWSIRLRSDPRLAMADYIDLTTPGIVTTRANRYWHGEMRFNMHGLPLDSTEGSVIGEDDEP